MKFITKKKFIEWLRSMDPETVLCLPYELLIFSCPLAKAMQQVGGAVQPSVGMNSWGASNAKQVKPLPAWAKKFVRTLEPWDVLTVKFCLDRMEKKGKRNG